MNPEYLELLSLKFDTWSVLNAESYWIEFEYFM